MPRPFFKRFAIWYALRRRGPDKWDVLTKWPVPDHFIVDLINADGQRKFIIRDMDEQGVSGLWFEHEQAQPENRALTNQHLKEYRAVFIERRKGYNFLYDGLFRFFISQLTFAPLRYRLTDKLAQVWFNRKPLARAGRLEVLRFFLKRTIKDRNYKASSVGFVADILTNRYAAHPDEKEVDNYYELMRESLAKSSDLHDNQGIYSLTPDALRTLSDYEEQERRHGDNVRVQLLVVALTLVTIVVAIWQEYHPDSPTETSQNVELP